MTNMALGINQKRYMPAIWKTSQNDRTSLSNP